ncbi:MAG: multidrug ABC transporter substrate-binding protein [Acidobacteria bacterium 13_2_20CM_2_66_4]|nr:MAG: multidrug ABC transporter substrate-binding protein [Acidobacteria bacterium 13_2_20CM_2_66_4]
MLHELKFALRFLVRSKGLAATVILTLALGIGANAAIFGVVRGVLLRPLVNRDEARLIYIRQSARGIGVENAAFSVPEIQDLRERIKTLSAFGDFSTIGFTMIGLGEPRVVRAGVVGGSYFEVMGLHPVLGRLLDAGDDGPSAAGAAVLTYRFWTNTLKSDPSVLGRTVRLGTRAATIVGVLEPSVPYPAETEIIANVVTSPHHLSATMVTGRVHRMTELFGRLAPGADLDSARAELRAVHGAILKEHPESYSAKADFRIDVVRLRDQITSRARTVLLVLLAASALVFVIACSNVANLILARTVRREGELAIRAALGAGTGALRRTLLAESLLLCGAGAAIGVLTARPMMTILARYASRFSVRALDVTVDSSLLWVGAGLAILSAVLLAYVPRLPSADASHGFALSSGGVRITGGTNRRLRLFAVTQIAASFVLLVGAGAFIKTLLALQAAQAGFETHQVLALDVPVISYGRTPDQILGFYKETMRRIAELPGIDRVAVGTTVPWRDAGNFGPGFEFSADGHVRAPGEEDPRARFRTVSPGFFAALGVPIIAGRDFTDADRRGGESVVIVSQTLAQRMFPNQDAVNRHMMWTDPVMKFIDVNTAPRRIVGVAADIDDENVVPGPALSVYHPLEQEIGGGRLFVHTRTDPYALVAPIKRIIREMSADQPVERPATLEDVRAEVLAPDRLNALVFGGCAAIALAIAVVGVAGVLAFSVSARTREFGIRLAIGSQPRSILAGVVVEGAVMAAIGVVVGGFGGFVAARALASVVQQIQLPGAVPITAAATVLIGAAVLASVLPAARAAAVDVMQALRSE